MDRIGVFRLVDSMEDDDDFFDTISHNSQSLASKRKNRDYVSLSTLYHSTIEIDVNMEMDLLDVGDNANKVSKTVTYAQWRDRVLFFLMIFRTTIEAHAI